MRYIFLLLVSCFFLFSCTSKDIQGSRFQTNQQLLQGNQENSASSDSEFLESSENMEKIVSMIPQNFVKRESFLSCVKNNIDMCITDQNQILGAEVKCEDYLVSSNRTMCEDQKKISEARKAKDSSVCDTITGDKGSCEYEVALSKGLEDGDVQVCKDLLESYRIPCNNEIIKMKALNAKDAKLCDGVIPYVDGDVFEQEFCEQEVQLRINEEKRIEKEKKFQENLEREMQVSLDQQESSGTGASE